MKAAFLIGRLVFGGFFLYSGLNHFKQREGLTKYAGAKNVPQPEQAVMLSGLMLVLGGASIMLGLKPKLGAAAIAAFLATASPAIHDFWTHSDPNARQSEMINFTKNLALLGAALALGGVKEPWPASVPVH